VREKWTDERLDDLNKKVDDGFADMRAEFRALRGEMRGEFGEIRGEFRSQTRLFIGLYGALIIALLANRF
jgi:hypothetical protein